MSTKTEENTKTTAVKKSVTRKKVAAKKKSVARKKASAKAKPVVMQMNQPATSMHACTSCNALPVGSVELTALLLVLVFSLTAVLVTSVHALTLRGQQLESVQSYYHAD